MGRGRGYNPISSIFTLSVDILVGFALCKFGYFSFSDLADMYIKSIK